MNGSEVVKKIEDLEKCVQLLLARVDVLERITGRKMIYPKPKGGE